MVPLASPNSREFGKPKSGWFIYTSFVLEKYRREP